MFSERKLQSAKNAQNSTWRYLRLTVWNFGRFCSLRCNFRLHPQARPRHVHRTRGDEGGSGGQKVCGGEKLRIKNVELRMMNNDEIIREDTSDTRRFLSPRITRIYTDNLLITIFFKS